MPLTLPPTAKSLGQKTVVVLSAVPAAGTGIPTVAETNAGLFGSLHFYTPLSFVPNQNTGEGPRKLGAKYVPTALGLITYPAVDAQYSYLPQSLGTAGAAGNEMYEKLVPGTKRTVVVLDGKDGTATTAVAANDIADIFLVECGARRKGETGDGEFDELSVTQSLVVVGGQPIATDYKFV